MQLKINTVASRLNAGLDFNPLQERLQPDRWKILRRLSIDKIAQEDLTVTDEQFNAFVARHAARHPVVEDNCDLMNSYLVVNPDGLLDNTDHHYHPTESLLNHSFATEFPKIRFNRNAYNKRD